jgi:hypothetical protein
MAISALGGGLNSAVNRCVALDFDTICQIITAGLGLNPVQAKMVPQAVYRQGLLSLSGPCIEFVHVIGNGGRAIEDEEGEGDGDDNPTGPASP